MKAWERLINYVTVRTPSDEESETVPSGTKAGKRNARTRSDRSSP